MHPVGTGRRALGAGRKAGFDEAGSHIAATTTTGVLAGWTESLLTNRSCTCAVLQLFVGAVARRRSPAAAVDAPISATRFWPTCFAVSSFLLRAATVLPFARHSPPL